MQFSDAVGQDVTIRALTNAILRDRIYPAYLLTGSRGIGKTSIARLFLKALRCENRTIENGQITTCNTCSDCTEIMTGSSVDVLEIDGASNNGVDHIREIRESVRYYPTRGARKIYLIDEVHMLTTAAFNALLKTLEEPPSHVVFLFATTEPHKIPATILSRVQRYDLRRASIPVIEGRLRQIVAGEGITADTASIRLIAQAAQGGLRDAVSLLDQAYSFSPDGITAESVQQTLGSVGQGSASELIESILNRDGSAALQKTGEWFSKGYDFRQASEVLLDLMHKTLVASLPNPSPLVGQSLGLSADEWQRFVELAKLRPLEELEMIFQVFHHGLDALSRSPNPFAYFSVLVLKATTAEILAFSNAAPSATVGTIQQPAQSTTPTVAVTPVQPQGSIQSRPAVVATTPERGWAEFFAWVKQRRPLLATLLEHAVSAQITETAIELVFGLDDQYKAEQVQTRLFQEQMTQLSREFFGRILILQPVLKKDAGEKFVDRKVKAQAQAEEQKRDAVLQSPLVQEARTLFGAEVSRFEWTTQGEA